MLSKAKLGYVKQISQPQAFQAGCNLGGHKDPPAVHYCRRSATDIRDLVQLTGILQNTHSS